MKLLKILILLILIVNVSTAHAEVKTFTAVGEYTMSDYESPDIAEQRALDYARRSAAEQAGVYLENYSRSKTFKLVEDEIKTVASDNIEIIDKKVTRKTLPPNDVIYFRVEITASVDTGYIDGVLKKKHEDRQKAIRAYEDLKKKQEEMDKHIAELKEKIAKIEAELPDEEISEEQDRRDREFQSMQKVYAVEDWLIEGKENQIAALHEAIKLNPKNDRVYCYFSGNNLYTSDSNTSKLAFRDAHKALVLNPNFYNYFSGAIAASYNAQFVAKNREEFENIQPKIRKLFTKCLELKPNDLESLYWRADSYKWDKEYNFHLSPEAIEDYIHVIELSPNFNFGDMFSIDFSSLSFNALLFSDYKDWNRLIAIYDRAIAKDPNNQNLQNNRNEIYSRVAIDREIENLTQKIKNNPNDIEYYKKRAEIYFNIQDCENVVNDYTQILKLNPNDKDVCISRASAYSLMFEYKKALADYNKALTLDPNDKEIYLNRASLYKKMEEYDKALADYDYILETISNDKEVYEKRASLYSQLKQYDKAIADYNEMLKLSTNDEMAEIYSKIAHIYELKKDYNKSIEYCTKALEIKPNTSDYIKRADMYFKVKQYDKAVDDYTMSITMEEIWYVYLHRAIVFKALKEYDKAIADYDSALNIAITENYEYRIPEIKRARQRVIDEKNQR